MKKPIPIKIVIFAYSLIAVLIFLSSIYAMYIGWAADNGNLSEYQSGFVQGMGFNPATFSFNDSAVYAGRMGPTFLIALLCILCLLKRWISAFVIIFIVDALLFTSSIGYLFKIITVVLLLLPPSRKYFANKPIGSSAESEESPNNSSNADGASAAGS